MAQVRRDPAAADADRQLRRPHRLVGVRPRRVRPHQRRDRRRRASRPRRRSRCSGSRAPAPRGCAPTPCGRCRSWLALQPFPHDYRGAFVFAFRARMRARPDGACTVRDIAACGDVFPDYLEGATPARRLTLGGGAPLLQDPARPGEAFSQPARGQRQHVDALVGRVDRPLGAESDPLVDHVGLRGRRVEARRAEEQQVGGLHFFQVDALLLGISPACSAAVRPRMLLPQDRPETL